MVIIKIRIRVCDDDGEIDDDIDSEEDGNDDGVENHCGVGGGA